MMSQSADENTFFRLAKPYAKEGIRVFPVQPSGKLPLIEKWPEMASSDLQKIQAWGREWSNANIGLLTGTSTNLLVLDVDGAVGAESLAEIQFKYEEALPETFTVQTGNGGKHYYLNHPGWKVTSTIGLLDKVDIRADGAYVVGPGSKHESGNIYKIISPPGVKCANPPQWLLDSITAIKERKTLALPLPEVILEGQRNNTLFSLACSMRNRNASEAAILAAVMMENTDRCQPPLFESEVLTLVSSAAKYPAESTGGAVRYTKTSTSGKVTFTGEVLEFNLTDAGNAERFVRDHGEKVKFSPQVRQWFVFDEKRFKKDDHLEVMFRVDATVRKLEQELNLINDSGERKKLLKHMERSENIDRKEALLKSCRHLCRVHVTEFDQQDMFLNVQNGTIDLTTGDLLPHEPKHLLSKITSALYQEDAECPLWLNHLDIVFQGNATLIDWFQRAVGYMITGDIGEQCLFILHGDGENGKSVTVGTIARLLADYAVSTRAQTLTRKQYSDGANNDVAALAGARLVHIGEGLRGKTLDEDLVKNVTGGDPIVARFLRQEFFEFYPKFKILWSTNHLPRIKDTTDSIWRRIRLIPFQAKIPPSVKDLHITEKLKNEFPGILQWAIEGCLRWQEKGLDPPSEVTVAVENYRAEEDPLGTFLDEKVVIDPDASAGATDLYKAYRAQAEIAGEKPMTQTTFGRILGERFKKLKTKNLVLYQGLQLNP